MTSVYQSHSGQPRGKDCKEVKSSFMVQYLSTQQIFIKCFTSVRSYARHQENKVSRVPWLCPQRAETVGKTDHQIIRCTRSSAGAPA